MGHSVALRAISLLAITLLSLGLSVNVASAHATNIASCSTGSTSNPKGVIVSGSSIWIGLSTSSQLGYSSTSNCSVTAYTAQNDPTYLAFFGNGYLAFTQKGSTNTNSCISTFSTSTDSITASYCSSGAGLDDVSTNPTSSTTVWASEYYIGNLADYSYTGGANIYGIQSPCGVLIEPEGVAVDNSGNVWFADEQCNLLWKFNPSTITWTSFQVNGGSTPWFVALDNTNGQVWITSLNDNGVYQFYMSNSSTRSIPVPCTQCSPYGIAVDPPDSRVYVSFQGGVINEYFYTSSRTWLCGGQGDYYGGTPFGISYEPPNYYWATLNAGDELVEGAC